MTFRFIRNIYIFDGVDLPDINYLIVWQINHFCSDFWRELKFYTIEILRELYFVSPMFLNFRITIDSLKKLFCVHVHPI